MATGYDQGYAFNEPIDTRLLATQLSSVNNVEERRHPSIFGENLAPYPSQICDQQEDGPEPCVFMPAVGRYIEVDGSGYGPSQGKPSRDIEGTKDNVYEAFGLFTYYFDSELWDLKKQILDASGSTQSTLDKKPVLKKASHKKQFEFNSQLLALAQEVINSTDLDEATPIGETLVKSIKNRNKIIQIADSSPGGWATVREYEAPILGDDSDDEKKIKSAESKAIKKLKTNYFSHVQNTTRTSFSFMRPDGNTSRHPVYQFQPRQIDYEWFPGIQVGASYSSPSQREGNFNVHGKMTGYKKLQ